MFPPRNVRGTGRNKGVAGNHRQLQLVRYTSYLRVLPGFFPLREIILTYHSRGSV